MTDQTVQSAPAKPAGRLRIDATDIARIAVFAALTAVLGLPGAFPVFGSVPITAQTLGVMLAGAVLGAWRGALSMVVLLVLVALGLPLLAGGHGGLAVFVGPTAGYLFGWIVGAFVIGAIVHAGGRKLTWPRTIVGVLVGGILVVYAIGIPVTALVLRLPLGPTALQATVFLPFDLIKAAITVAVTMTLVRAYPRAFRVRPKERA
ncbi:BioY family transporter [Subtercola boreus]|uniref:Biotin transporter n=1 Tax=Subtercola boreus TaxID=120213 RepID=A0A3E0VLH8_9MICO|nr:biotin transporter BioY [Subtercola boreus]RFA10822.1 BioY family transporter [Subtercola boreus]TQL55600.1 biotin transport system substrate-specific component [Subtercola boreus]